MSSDSLASEITIAGPSNRKTHLDLHHLSPEIIIIGAGIAGSALAYSLSHSGRSVLLIERDLSQPDRIVGELLQPGGVRALDTLGLGGCLEGIDAVGVEGYCVVNGANGGMVDIPYPDLEIAAGDGKVEWAESEKNDDIQFQDEKKAASGRKSTVPWHVTSRSGRKEGRSFHHGRFISALRDRCLHDAPNLTVVEGTVRDLLKCDHTNRVIGVSVAFRLASAKDEQGEAQPQETVVKSIYAPVTIVADGLFSKFRNQPGLKFPTPKLRSHFVGVILKDVDLPVPRHGTVCLTPQGPVLLYQIADEGRETRMLVDVKGKLPNVADGSLKQHILDDYLPYLPASLHSAIRSALDTQRLRTMPNSFLPPTQQGHHSSLAGAILVGDSYNMRHPLTGGGMTVAFNDAVLLTELLKPSDALPAGREGLEWDVISKGLREWFWERKKVASVVNILSIALYDLFGGADSDLAILREGCFRYFELGGDRVAGPVGLLSAITPKPILLFYHFFCVAFYSIYCLFVYGRPATSAGEKQRPPSFTEIPSLVATSGSVFWTACVVLLPVIWTEIRP